MFFLAYINKSNPMPIRNNKITGKINQIIKAKAPRMITANKQIKPRTIVNNLTKNPRPREITLKINVSKNFLIENPRPYLVMSLRQG